MYLASKRVVEQRDQGEHSSVKHETVRLELEALVTQGIGYDEIGWNTVEATFRQTPRFIDVSLSLSLLFFRRKENSFFSFSLPSPIVLSKSSDRSPINKIRAIINIIYGN